MERAAELLRGHAEERRRRLARLLDHLRRHPRVFVFPRRPRPHVSQPHDASRTSRAASTNPSSSCTRPTNDLFEGSCVYRIKGTNQFLLPRRVHRQNTAPATTAHSRPIASTASGSRCLERTPRRRPSRATPTCAPSDGSPLWAEGVSHGELLREGSDETMTVDPKNLRFLYQGLPLGSQRARLPPPALPPRAPETRRGRLGQIRLPAPHECSANESENRGRRMLDVAAILWCWLLALTATPGLRPDADATPHRGHAARLEPRQRST